MKVLTLVLTLIFASAAFSQQITTPVFKDTVGTLNQVTPETDDDGQKIQPREEQQDVDERLYWEKKNREDKEWESQKRIDDYRYDVPGP